MLTIDARKRLREFTFDVAVEVERGVTIVVGPSGAGKTTLLNLIAGLVRPDDGTIALNGTILADARTFIPPEKRNVALVFQEYALFPHLNVEQNVAYGLRARHIAREEQRSRVASALARLEIAALRGARVDELSGGQRQRVALARALVIEPAAILLDEPLAALDPDTRARVRGELAAVLEEVHVPVLFVTHDEADRAAFAGRVLHIERGRLREPAR